jgi:hypothetical protein
LPAATMLGTRPSCRCAAASITHKVGPALRHSARGGQAGGVAALCQGPWEQQRREQNAACFQRMAINSPGQVCYSVYQELTTGDCAVVISWGLGCAEWLSIHTMRSSIIDQIRQRQIAAHSGAGRAQSCDAFLRVRCDSP